MDKTIGYDATMKPKGERDGRGAFAPGDAIAGRYVVERMLGEGGMGIVHQCLDRYDAASGLQNGRGTPRRGHNGQL